MLIDLKPEINSSIAVFGVGSAGLATIMATARFTSAAQIAAIDIRDSKLGLAKTLGATRTINSWSKDLVRAKASTGRSTTNVSSLF